MSITGVGDAVSLAHFIHEIKIRDPYIYESEILISNVRSSATNLKLEAVLSKHYINGTVESL